MFYTFLPPLFHIKLYGHRLCTLCTCAVPALESWSPPQYKCEAPCLPTAGPGVFPPARSSPVMTNCPQLSGRGQGHVAKRKALTGSAVKGLISRKRRKMEIYLQLKTNRNRI